MEGDVDQYEDLPCAEKLVFNTKKEAETSATVAEHQHGNRLGVYKCSHCKLWHLKTVYE